MGVGPGTAATETCADRLGILARDHGARPAIREKRRGIWRTSSWAEFAGEVAAVARGLHRRGLVPQSGFVFLGDNRARLLATLAAAHRLGAVAVPLFADAGADELRPHLAEARPTHAFAENQEQVDKLLALIDEVPSLGTIVYASDRGMRHYDHPALVAYDTLLAEGMATGADAPQHGAAPQDTAALFFSPGGGGAPQAVRLSHAALLDRARALAAMGGIGAEDAMMAYLPPAWVAQFLLAYAVPLATGAAVCCPESSETFLADMREIAPTALVATPRVLGALEREIERRLARASGLVRGLHRRRREAGGANWLHDMLVAGPLRDQLGLARLRAGFVAGDLVAPEALGFFRALGVPMVPLYGATETGCVLAGGGDGAAIGPAAPGVELAIGAGDEVMARVAALGSDWIATGDAGALAGGTLSVTGRLADLAVLADGTRFAPRPLENALKRSAFVREAVVFGAGLEQAVVLVDLDTEEVGRWANARSLAYTGRVELARHPEVQALIAQALAEANGAIMRGAGTARVILRRAAILDAELDPDDRLLTRIGTLRRAEIAQRHAALIAALATGGAEAEGGAILAMAPGAAANPMVGRAA